ncbi:hypothetical protein RFI_09974 [Reticulomyxa filosa]|uniref:WD-40 repeat protein n=1 Tax=Reticulomyxa filosa TaxID=46433 RepID=X6NMJ6_RETFI|nr:hypothetical protein RFI_09974 [Reticulomyxa filosa]|eukprot:ETO27158.1 hypothetical protein RFI_09974 [Reticulomyxa filosa]
MPLLIIFYKHLPHYLSKGIIYHLGIEFIPLNQKIKFNPLFYEYNLHKLKIIGDTVNVKLIRNNELQKLFHEVIKNDYLCNLLSEKCTMDFFHCKSMITFDLKSVYPCLRTFMEINIIVSSSNSCFLKFFNIDMTLAQLVGFIKFTKLIINKLFVDFRIVIIDYCDVQIFYKMFLMYIKVQSKVQAVFIFHHQRTSQEKTKKSYKNELKFINEKEEVQMIIRHWIRTLNIKLGWIKDFDKFVINYVSLFILFLNANQNITILFNIGVYHLRIFFVWDVDNNKQIQSFNGHSSPVLCVKFSYYCRNVICSSSSDCTIRFWDFKHNKQLKIFNKHTGSVCEIEFSPFHCGKYLCSGSSDKTIRLWDVGTSEPLHVFNGHTHIVFYWCGGNGYIICSGSFDQTIRIWDIETTKQLNVFKGHQDLIRNDKSVRLWDIRSGKQMQVFNGHTNYVCSVEYSPFVMKISDEVVGGNSNVICSGSRDNTIHMRKKMMEYVVLNLLN